MLIDEPSDRLVQQVELTASREEVLRVQTSAGTTGCFQIKEPSGDASYLDPYHGPTSVNRGREGLKRSLKGLKLILSRHFTSRHVSARKRRPAECLIIKLDSGV